MAGLTRALDWFDKSLQNVVRARGYAPLHRTQSMILMHIALGIDRPSDIAREMGLTRQNVHHMAKTLIDGGMIESSPDPEDPRRSIYRLSEESGEVRDLALEALAGMEQVLAQRIGRHRFDGLKSALEADWGPEITDADELGAYLGRRRPR